MIRSEWRRLDLRLLLERSRGSRWCSRLELRLLLLLLNWLERSRGGLELRARWVDLGLLLERTCRAGQELRLLLRLLRRLLWLRRL